MYKHTTIGLASSILNFTDVPSWKSTSLFAVPGCTRHPTLGTFCKYLLRDSWSQKVKQFVASAIFAWNIVREKTSVVRIAVISDIWQCLQYTGTRLVQLTKLIFKNLCSKLWALIGLHVIIYLFQQLVYNNVLSFVKCY